jgi:hypothetical protein
MVLYNNKLEKHLKKFKFIVSKLEKKIEVRKIMYWICDSMRIKILDFDFKMWMIVTEYRNTFVC